jgi:hypothetical protein
LPEHMKIKRRFLLWLMQTRFYVWLMLHVIPFVRFSMYYTKIEPSIVAIGYKYLEPGDFILAVDKKKLTSLLVPGIFTHAAFCIAKGMYKKAEISEMTHENYHLTTWCRFCNESDRVVIIDNPKWSQRYRNEMVKKDKTFKDCKYDTSFEFGINALYCSEKNYHLDFKRTLGIDTSDLCGLGRKYVSPDDIAHASNARWKWDSDAEKVRQDV